MGNLKGRLASAFLLEELHLKGICNLLSCEIAGWKLWGHPLLCVCVGGAGAGDSEEEDRRLAMMGESERDWRYVERRGGGGEGRAGIGTGVTERADKQCCLF